MPFRPDYAVVGRILLTALPYLEPREFRVLAAMLSVGPPGCRMHITDRQLSEVSGYKQNHVRLVVRELRAKRIPGTDRPWVGCEGHGRIGRLLWVNDPGQIG